MVLRQMLQKLQMQANLELVGLSQLHEEAAAGRLCARVDRSPALLHQHDHPARHDHGLLAEHAPNEARSTLHAVASFSKRRRSSTSA